MTQAKNQDPSDRDYGLKAAADLLRDIGSPHAGVGDSVLPAAAPAGMPARLGDFVILRQLGRGGMGEVYLARQTSLGRLVALKILPASLASRLQAIERFLREARVVGSLDHPALERRPRDLTPEEREAFEIGAAEERRGHREAWELEVLPARKRARKDR